jgi:hypothetical protein
MATRKRKLQEDAAEPNHIGYGKAQLIEDLLLMIRQRMRISDISGLSFVRLEHISREKADLLTELLERETRR